MFGCCASCKQTIVQIVAYALYDPIKCYVNLKLISMCPFVRMNTHTHQGFSSSASKPHGNGGQDLKFLFTCLEIILTLPRKHPSSN